jgi:hypothetical protein
MAGDHPNLYLADYLGSNGCNLSVPPLDLSGDVDAEIAALSDPPAELAFLAGHIDMQRLALAGHSAGAHNVAQDRAEWISALQLRHPEVADFHQDVD